MATFWLLWFFFLAFDISEPPFIIIACCPGPYSFVVSTNLMLFEGYMCVPWDIFPMWYWNLWLRMGAMNGAGDTNPDGSSCCPSFCFYFYLDDCIVARVFCIGIVLLFVYNVKLGYSVFVLCLVVCIIHVHRLRSTWNRLSFSFTWVLFPIQA